jgi:DNA mismatch repair ATPase MutS
LAGLPGYVLARAETMLQRIREGERSINGVLSSDIRAPPAPEGLSRRSLDQLKTMAKNIGDLDINHLTPLEALNYLQKLRQHLMSIPLPKRDPQVRQEPDLFSQP